MFLWFHIFLWFTYDFANSVGRVSLLYEYLCMCICRHHGFVYLTCLEHPLASLKQLHKGAVALSMRILFFCRTGKSLCEPASLCTHFAKFRRTFLFIVCILFMYQFDCSRSLRIALFSFHLFLLIFFLFKSKTFFIEQALLSSSLPPRKFLGERTKRAPLFIFAYRVIFFAFKQDLTCFRDLQIAYSFRFTVSWYTLFAKSTMALFAKRQLHTVAIPRWAVVEP